MHSVHHYRNAVGAPSPALFLVDLGASQQHRTAALQPAKTPGSQFRMRLPQRARPPQAKKCQIEESDVVEGKEFQHCVLGRRRTQMQKQQKSSPHRSLEPMTAYSTATGIIQQQTATITSRRTAANIPTTQTTTKSGKTKNKNIHSDNDINENSNRQNNVKNNKNERLQYEHNNAGATNATTIQQQTYQQRKEQQKPATIRDQPHAQQQ